MTSQVNNTLWRRLTAPHPSITDVEQRRQSQLLAALMLVLGLTTLMAGIILTYRNSTLGRGQSYLTSLAPVLVILAVLFFLNRSGRYKLSAYLFIAQMFLTVHVFPLLTNDLSWLFFAGVLMILSALLLPWRGVLTVFFSSVAVQIALLVVSPGQTTLSNLGLLVVFFVLAPVLMVFIRHRNGLETERQTELRASNEKLREAEATLEKRVAERTRDLEIAADVSRQIATILDLGALLNTIVERTKASFGLYHVSVFLYEPDSKMLTLEAGAGSIGQAIKAEGRRFQVSVDHGLVTQAARTQAAVLVNDVSKAPEYSANPHLPNTRSELALPMLVVDQLVGVLDFQSDQLDRFSPDDARVMTTLAEQMAIAVDNARLFKETESARYRAEVIGEINSKMASAADEQDILAAVNQFEASSVMLSYLQLDPQGQPQTVEIAAIRSGDGQPIPLSGAPATVFPVSADPTLPIIFAHGSEPLFVENVRLDPLFSDTEREVIRRRNWQSLIFLPLRSAGKWQAVITLGWDKPQTFNDELRGLFKVLMPRLADNVAARRAYLATETARQEIERLYAEQVQIAEQLREVDNVKSRFLASMSHELRTPLNAILNFTKFVATGMLGPVNEKQVDALNKTVDSGRHLLSLINDVLDITKIESKMLNLFVESDVNLQDEVQTVFATAETLLTGRPVSLNRDIAPALPTLVGDKRRIRQILLNLVSNACKFTEMGNITISAHEKEGQVLLSVKDTGPGIAPEDQELIFESFRQTRVGLSQGGGTGLGLAIAKRLAEAHGGRLWLESTVGIGSTFYVSLPVRSEVLLETIQVAAGA